MQPCATKDIKKLKELSKAVVHISTRLLTSIWSNWSIILVTMSFSYFLFNQQKLTSFPFKNDDLFAFKIFQRLTIPPKIDQFKHNWCQKKQKDARYHWYLLTSLYSKRFQSNFFIEGSSTYFYTSFDKFCVQIGQLLP